MSHHFINALECGQVVVRHLRGQMQQGYTQSERVQAPDLLPPVMHVAFGMWPNRIQHAHACVGHFSALFTLHMFRFTQHRHLRARLARAEEDSQTCINDHNATMQPSFLPSSLTRTELALHLNARF